jgi:hypothetical protein
LEREGLKVGKIGEGEIAWRRRVGSDCSLFKPKLRRI